MIMRNINTDLIDAMKIYLPKGNNLANALMDILYLGKEATYRRLRGDGNLLFYYRFVYKVVRSID